MTVTIEWHGRAVPLTELDDDDIRSWVNSLAPEAVIDVLAAGTHGEAGQKIRATALNLTVAQLRTALIDVMRRVRDGED